ncbi:MAG: hypothetical protein CM1200mP24_07820 [Gammaproteobacteria bacterium]|nr:MAG: hypothetical protein CM1200mP24_07820 [Gammaproteobacteria bacterium]
MRKDDCSCPSILLIVESLGQTIVVDTCFGNDKSRGYPKWNDLQTDFLNDFAQAGFWY